MTEEQASFDELLQDADEDETGNLAAFPDDGPKSGTWVDVDDVLAMPDEDEMEQGRLLGESIDVDDHDDTGVES